MPDSWGFSALPAGAGGALPTGCVDVRPTVREGGKGISRIGGPEGVAGLADAPPVADEVGCDADPTGGATEADGASATGAPGTGAEAPGACVEPALDSAGSAPVDAPGGTAPDAPGGAVHEAARSPISVVKSW